MKLIREYINEKFTDTSDPVHDMGIGMKGIIDKSIKNIYELDYNNVYIRTGFDYYFFKTLSSGFSIQDISVTNYQFIFRYFSNRYYDKNKKEIDKKDYSISLLKQANILTCMENNIKIYPDTNYNEDKEHSPWTYYFTIKSQFIKYFEQGIHYPPK